MAVRDGEDLVNLTTDARLRGLLERLACGAPASQLIGDTLHWASAALPRLWLSVAHAGVAAGWKLQCAPDLPAHLHPALQVWSPSTVLPGAHSTQWQPQVVSGVQVLVRLIWASSGEEVLGYALLCRADAAATHFELTTDELETVNVATHLVLLAWLRDQTQREVMQRHRDELWRESEYLRSVIFDTVEDVIFYLQVEGERSYRFISVNRAFLRQYGVSESFMIGRMLHEVLPPEIRDETLVHYDRAIATRERQKWEVAVTTRSGQQHNEITLIPVFDRDGRCTHLVGTVHDVTGRKHEEARRAHVQQQMHQVQRMQALGTLAGGIAHDFNNIIAAIGGNAELLAQGLAEQPALADLVADIRGGAKRAADLVRQILTFTRSSDSVQRPFDPRSVVTEALRMLHATLPPHARIVTDFQQSIPWVHGDSTQYHQVVVNLITNAFHAMHGREGVIDVRLARRAAATVPEGLLKEPRAAAYVHLQVTDSGFGMDASTLKRATEPFFTTRSPGEGTGLGLSVVHGIVEAHGGGMRLTSAPGRGTTVDIYLPAAAATPAAATTVSAVEGQGERILYVDDEEALVMLMQRALGRRGYQITGFLDPRVALQEFARQPERFDLVITDLAMPGMTGAELAAKVREIRPDVPIIMTSGYIRPQDRETAERLRIEQLVYKSNTIDELAEALTVEIRKLRAAANG